MAKPALGRARSEWVEGQVHYHWDTARKMHGIDDGLERLAKELLWLVVACAIAAVALEVSGRAHGPAIVVGACAAALPAFVAALGGIMFQSEARRLRFRSEATCRGLLSQQAALQTEMTPWMRHPSEEGTRRGRRASDYAHCQV